MMKRLFLVAVLTGTGHLVNLISLRFITNYANQGAIAFIGELDSLALLIVSITAFGLQLSSTREIAVRDNDWQKVYYSTQSARLTMAMLLMFLGLSGFLYTKNYMFFIAPIIALNADYALYGRGKPILGAIVAFIRITIPSITVILSSVYFIKLLPLLFSISILLAYFTAGFIVSKILNVNYLVKPKFKSLIEYVKNIKIGFANLAYFFVGIGILNILSYINSEETVSIAYMALKLYMIFIGVRRIIVQSFFKEIKELKQSLKVDYLSMVAGTIFLSLFLFYPKTTISLLFDDSYAEYSLTFVILGVAGFISSITSSSGARLLLQNKDKQFSANFIVAAIVTICSGVCFSFFIADTPSLVVLACLLGEITISVLNMSSLKEKNFLINRLRIMYPVLLASLLFYITKFSFSDNIWALSISIITFSLIVFLDSKRVLNSKTLN
ncbi:MAG: hypothetical protein O2906_04955 [Bacteroidetes bacterium]|nr:hypothetical protein [Bacteroidota bacterium]MDA0860305.1 hypothetical protein [Bacteroidota bacterium]MDA1318513.1 hypothetical protein [Bacteroidota bacterium]